MAYSSNLSVSRDLSVEPEASRDAVTVDASGKPISEGIEGVETVRLTPHVDQRGSLTEVVNYAWPFWSEGVAYAYYVTIRPGRIKGWGMHKLQADRYYIPSGKLRVVLYDGRTQSPTFKQFREFYFADTPGLIRIPPGVWHADQNWGDEDAVIFNFPTEPYNHAEPDKYRIDPHSGVIPFDWGLRDG
jgi:dTDP-4-dehydrorhamnose 3,5-epimerase